MKSELLTIVQRKRRDLRLHPPVPGEVCPRCGRKAPESGPESTPVAVVPPVPPVAEKLALPLAEIPAPLSALEQALKKLSEDDSKN